MRPLIASSVLLLLIFSIIPVQNQSVRPLGQQDWQLKDIMYRFNAYMLQDQNEQYDLQIGDLKVLGVGQDLSQQNVTLPECLIFHLNHSATFLRVCNFMQPEFFLNSTELYSINKDLIMSLFQAQNAGGNNTQAGGNSMASAAAPLTNDTLQGNDQQLNSSQGSGVNQMGDSGMLDQYLDIYHAFKLNQSFPNILSLFEVYDFMPSELNDFLIGQGQGGQVNNSGAAASNASNASSGVQGSNQTSNASVNASRRILNHSPDHIDIPPLSQPLVQLFKQSVSSAQPPADFSLQSVISGLPQDSWLTRQLMNASQMLQQQYPQSFPSAEQNFFQAVEFPMVNAIADFINNGIRIIQAHEQDIISGLSLQNQDFLKILWDQNQMIPDLSPFFQAINLRVPDGGWVIYNNLKECVQLTMDDLLFANYGLSGQQGSDQGMEQPPVQNLTAFQARNDSANSSANASQGAGQQQQSIETKVICTKRGLRRAFRYLSLNANEDDENDQEFKQKIDSLQKKPWLYIFSALSQPEDKFQLWRGQGESQGAAQNISQGAQNATSNSTANGTQSQGGIVGAVNSTLQGVDNATGNIASNAAAGISNTANNIAEGVTGTGNNAAGETGDAAGRTGENAANGGGSGR